MKVDTFANNTNTIILRERLIMEKLVTERNIQKLVDKIVDLNEDNNFCHGNNEVTYELTKDDVRILSTIEAPNHTTLTIEFNKDMIVNMLCNDFKKTYIQEYAKRISDFDVSTEFNELWSQEFAIHNSFTPKEFIEILETDKNHFDNRIQDLLHEHKILTKEW